MRSLGKTFLAIFLPLIAVGGFFLAARYSEVIVWFWAIFVFSLSVALLIKAGPNLIEFSRRFTRFPALLRQVAALEEQVDELAFEKKEAEETLTKAESKGILEGKARVYGEQFAAHKEPPTFLSVSRMEDEMVLVGRIGSSGVRKAARYFVEEEPTGRKFGVVEVVDFEEDRGIVYMRCVDATVRKFWERLNDKVDTDEAQAPDGFHLTPYVTETSHISDDRTIFPEAKKIEQKPEVLE